MKKSTIWLLTIVMACTIGSLLYFQIMYLENMVKMREEQFSENVMRALYSTAGYLERQETLHFLEQDANVIESSLYFDTRDLDEEGLMEGELGYEGPVPGFEAFTGTEHRVDPLGTASSGRGGVSSRYHTLREVIRSQYLYQKGLLNEVILTILRDAESRPVMDRADSTLIKDCLSTELANNGLTVPFEFAIYNERDQQVYQSAGYVRTAGRAQYTQVLFPNTNARYYLNITFPTKGKYVFETVRFIIPTLGFTLLLLAVFIYTIILAFRQKKLSEMKTDFISNMTHELKTPISTISLAAQMLDDSSVRKSESSLKHLSHVITEESKRLRLNVDKVLQMSVFDKANAAALKLTDVDANTVISDVVSTFKIKVEKVGGTLGCNLDAADAEIRVDKMQFTNVIFNLLDNAVKYRDEQRDLNLEVSTRNLANSLEIRVADNGIGIRKDDLKRIFDKFFRVNTGNRHDVKGFGLGLAYVKRMVELFGGKISVESDPGSGTTFIITLPQPDSTN